MIQNRLQELKALKDKCGIVCQHGISFWWPTSEEMIKEIRLDPFKFNCGCEADPKQEHNAWIESKETIEEEHGDLRN